MSRTRRAAPQSSTDNGTPLNKADDFVRLVPNANLCGAGAAGYDYTVSDGSLTDIGHVTIDIICINDAPVAEDDTVTATEDTISTPRSPCYWPMTPMWTARP